MGARGGKGGIPKTCTNTKRTKVLNRRERKADDEQDSMQRSAWVATATGNIATRSATSLLYFGDIGAHTAIIATLPPRDSGKRERKERKGKRGKRATKTKPQKKTSGNRTKTHTREGKGMPHERSKLSREQHSRHRTGK